MPHQATELFIFVEEIDSDDGKIPDELHGPQVGLELVDRASLLARTNIFIGG